MQNEGLVWWAFSSLLTFLGEWSIIFENGTICYKPENFDFEGTGVLNESLLKELEFVMWIVYLYMVFLLSKLFEMY